MKIMEELKNKFDKIQEVISFIEVSENYLQIRVGFPLRWWKALSVRTYS